MLYRLRNEADLEYVPGMPKDRGKRSGERHLCTSIGIFTPPAAVLVDPHPMHVAVLGYGVSVPELGSGKKLCAKP